jgi:long-chain acyl-CoA synthetase
MTLSWQAIHAALTAPGQPFEITEVVVGGVRLRDWKNTPLSMAAILAQSRTHGEREFIVYRDERLSFAAHYARAARLAQRLVGELGVRQGDRVAVAMRNLPEWSIAFWAAAAAGAIVVPLNAWWTAEELRYGLEDSGSRVAFVDAERLQRLQPVRTRLPELHHVVATRVTECPAGVLDFAALIEGADPAQALPAIAIGPDDPATIFYTSGTTGFPKGALGTQRNFCGVALSVPFNGVQQLLRAGRSAEEIAALAQAPPPVALLTVPLFHVTGCHAMMLGMLCAGGRLVMMHKWDPAEAVELIERERATLFGAVPAMAWQLTESLAGRDLPSVASVGYGGAPAAPELLRRLRAGLPAAMISNGWGITETSSAITMIAGEDYAARPDSAGRPFPILDLQVVDEQGRALPANATGELWVRGPNVVTGYWNKPEATAAAFSEGWFHTGDIGRIDEEGYVYIVDRLKDMIIRGGENVYCAEVEAVLLEHPAVNAACVFGVPHATLGEEVGCVVQLAEGRTLDEEALRAHARGHLARFKVPTRIWLGHEPLPLGATGKVQKKQVREACLARLVR